MLFAFGPTALGRMLNILQLITVICIILIKSEMLCAAAAKCFQLTCSILPARTDRMGLCVSVSGAELVNYAVTVTVIAQRVVQMYA